MKKSFLQGYCLALCLFALPFGLPQGVAAKSASNGSKSSAYSTPKAGSDERKAIMDALRKPVQKSTKCDVIFQVEDLRAKNGWAFMVGTALSSSNKKPVGDYATAALLRQQGKTWKVLVWGFCTDVSVIEDAKKQYPQAPRAIFPG